MNKKQVEQEFRKIDFELFVNNTETTPYFPEVVTRIELLLLTQVYLANILYAKTRRNKRTERFETAMYNKTIAINDHW